MSADTSQWIHQFNALSLLGALMLWGTFFLLGIIARRYELVFQKWTGWKSMMLAPSGILVYVVIVTAGWWNASPALQPVLDGIAYTALVLSALATWVVVARFHKVIRQLTESGEGK